jgi:hypothetical protein
MPSEMKMSPEESTATPYGAASSAEVAGPPSPEKPLLLWVPATVVITPPVVTLRMISLPLSTI